jgi:hypothetical protein
VRAQLPKSLIFYAAVPDAGFFLDHARYGTGEHHFGAEMRITWQIANASHSWSPQCVAAHSSTPSDCIFPQNFAEYIKTPLHVTQSQYDAWQLPNILALGCDPPKGDCNASQLSSFQQYRLDGMAALKAAGLYEARHGYGIWNDACIAHTQGYYGDYMDNSEWEVPAKSGVTLAQSLKQWLDSSMATTRATAAADTAAEVGGGLSNSNMHVDQVGWPKNAPCSKLGLLDAAAGGGAVAEGL